MKEPHPPSSRAPGHRWPLLALGALVVTMAAAATDDDPAKLRRETDLLRRQLDVVSSERFYLELDPAGSSLKLMLEGVPLREYPVVDTSVGRPRVLFVARDLPEGWRDRIWSGGRLDPRRHYARGEIRVPDDEGEEAAAAQEGDDEVVEIPPTPEEAFPALESFRVRFEGGLALEILEPGVSAAATRMENLASVLWPSDTDRIRIRLVLEAGHGQELYRSLPDDVRLLILPDPR